MRTIVSDHHLWHLMELLRKSPFPVEDQVDLLLSLIAYKRIADSSNYAVPAEASWDNLKAQHREIGAQISKNFLAIEHANQLHRLFYSNHLTEISDSLLEALISMLDQLNLKEELVSAQELGAVCQKLTERFININRYKELYLAQNVAKLIAALSNPTEDCQVYDPRFNLGELLYGCLDYCNGKAQNYHGEEIQIRSARVAKLLLFIRGDGLPALHSGNSLENPTFTDGYSLMKFDRVVCCPPVGMRDWGHDKLLADPFNRFQHGIPPKTKGELAYIQHSLASLTPDGIACLLLPAGCLFRLGAEEGIRRSILQFDLLEAVIALPQGIFQGTGIATSILVFNRKKTSTKKNTVLFIDASQPGEAISKRGKLNDDVIDHIVQVYRDFVAEEGFSALTDITDVLHNGSDLSPGRYIEQPEPVAQYTLEEDLNTLKEAEHQRKEAQKGFEEFLKSLGY